MEFVLYEQKGQYAIITINREKALNALNSAVLDELDKTLDSVDLDQVRCLILTGAGQKSFVAVRWRQRVSSATSGASWICRIPLWIRLQK